MEKIKELLTMEEGPKPAASLAVKLGISEQYVRMLADGKKPSWRLQRDIDSLYKKVVK